MTRILDSQPDIIVLGRSGNEELLETARRTRPDVVIVSLTDSTRPTVAESLLRQSPALRLLGVSRDQAHGFLYEMRPFSQPLGELSPDGLVSAIRGAADPARWAFPHA